MSTQESTRNEAAERLRNLFDSDGRTALREEFDKALAAERRATVERIRTRALALRKKWGAEGLPASLEAILNEENAR